MESLVVRRGLLRAGKAVTGAVAACAVAATPHSGGLLQARADAHALAVVPPTASPASRAFAGGPGDLPALLSGVFDGSNQFVAGGIALGLLGAALAAARSLLAFGLEAAARRVMVTAEVDSRDDAYRWLMLWLSRQPGFSESRCVSVHTSLASTFGSTPPPASGNGSDNGSGGDGSAGSAAAARVTYLPAPGTHLLRFQGRWFAVSRRRAPGSPQLAANARLLVETLRLAAFGTSRAPLEALIAAAAAEYERAAAARTRVHAVDGDGYWQQVGSRPVRPLSSVVLPAGEAEALLEDCREFLASEAWYAHHGIPWRRGYLLYGPPGSGKTSLVTGLAGALGLDVYVATLASPAMTDEALRALLNSAAPRALLLLEDVDAAFASGNGGGAGAREAAGGAGARLTFSGLLNAIDGVAAQQGRLLFMTTNHIERLDEALIRPGRVDVRCRFENATREQIEALFYSFYADRRPLAGATATAATTTAAATAPMAAAAAATAVPAAIASIDDDGAGGGYSRPAAAAAATAATLRRQAREFAAALAARAPGGASMAAVQGHLMRYKRDAAAALAAAPALADELAARAAGGGGGGGGGGGKSAPGSSSSSM